MNKKLMTLFITSCLMSGVALAGDDCTDPVADWQPKENLRQMMTDYGWDVRRIKVDDGCYEIKGLDRKGHRVKATFSPATLKIVELEVKFDGSGDSSDYLGLGVTPNINSAEKSNLNAKNKTSKNKPKVTIE